MAISRSAITAGARYLPWQRLETSNVQHSTLPAQRLILIATQMSAAPGLLAACRCPHLWTGSGYFYTWPSCTSAQRDQQRLQGRNGISLCGGPSITRLSYVQRVLGVQTFSMTTSLRCLRVLTQPAVPGKGVAQAWCCQVQAWHQS